MLRAALVAVGLLAMGSSNHRVPPGTWGGEGVRLEVAAKGAHLELDCGRGELSEPLALDREDRLAVKGTFTREGGPARADGSDTRAVVYSGTLADDVLELSARPDGGGEAIGTWKLTRGREVRLRKCR